MKLRLLSTFLATLIGSATLAAADTVAFTRDNGTLPTFTTPSFSVTVSAYWQTLSGDVPIPLKQTGKGLTASIKNREQIEGPLGNEYLRLAFDTSVQFTGFTLSNTDLNRLSKASDTLRLLENDGTSHDFTFPSPKDKNQTIIFDQPLAGTVFTFTTPAAKLGTIFSDYSLMSVDATPLSRPYVAALVPLPPALTAGLLLFATLLGLNLLRHVRRD
ncbi:MAG: hypothetical protein ACM359_11160 [Bacillota bacterium]